MTAPVEKVKKSKPCLVEGCTGNAHWHDQGRLGYCLAHYYRVSKYGTPFAGAAPRSMKSPHGAHKKFIEDVVLKYDGDECLIWPFYRPEDGYGRTSHNGRTATASRVVCELVHGPAPHPKMDACHDCGKGHEGCVTPSHLRWDTRKGNLADRVKHGTTTKPWKTKLTEDDVIQIRSLLGTASQREIGERFGVAQSAICSIANGRNWGWLTKQKGTSSVA